MGGIFGWLKYASKKVLDPGREDRIKVAVAQVESALGAQRKAFDLRGTFAAIDVYDEDVPIVLERVYHSLVARAWRDSVISPAEREALDWAAGVLEIEAERGRAIFKEVGVAALRPLVSQLRMEARVSPIVVEQLRAGAREMGLSLGDLLRTHFWKEVEELLRELFARVEREGRVLEKEWARLVETAKMVGLGRNELLVAVRAQAERLVEGMLATAKGDERITREEEAALTWLLQNIVGRQEYAAYVRSEIERVKWIQSIEAGRLPSLPANGQIGLRSGEIMHVLTPARFLRTRQLKSGPRTDTFHGTMTLTDGRLLFAATGLDFEVNYRRVIGWTPYRDGFRLEAGGKGSGTYLPAADPDMVTRICRVAIHLANQTIVRAADSTRNIPRDVRQRVWQRDGGRCVQCGATDYLEFDHVIPVARGGSNGEQNVQVLCRRCNGKKSDHI